MYKTKVSINSKISDAQLTANRANAQHSTGPRSSAGKTRVSINAVKTGLTGCTVVLPAESAEEYRAHIKAYEHEFKPVGIQERELVQSLADIRWRLNRIPGLEAALDTNARALIAPDHDNVQDLMIREFLTTVDVFDRNETRLHNIHLHEVRLARRREKELAELRALQQARREREAQEKDEAAKQAAAAAVETKAKEAQPTAAAPQVKTATVVAAATAGSTQNGFEFTNQPATPEEQPEQTRKAAA